MGDKTLILRDLNLLDPDFLKIVKLILEDCKGHNLPFEAFETGRTADRQKALVQGGFSRTLKSKHLVTYDNAGNLIQPALAADLVLHYNHGGQMVWSWGQIEDNAKVDISMYYMMGELVKNRYSTIKRKGTLQRLAWGGAWAKFLDLPHIEVA